MKKYIILMILAATHMVAEAQTVNVHFKNGQVINYPSENVDYIDFSAKPEDPFITQGTVVDLGLSVNWASCNIGASKPEETGNYYARGETQPKSTYSENNYSYYNASTNQYIEIGDDISGTQYDAATVKLGNEWRMPTHIEMQELYNCTHEWVQINGVNGCKITGKNGNSIFLPASGYKSFTGTPLNKNNYFFIRDGSKGGMSGDIETNHLVGEMNLYQGMPIRPVINVTDSEGNPIDHSNDFFVTNNISASFLGGSISKVNGKILSGSKISWLFENNSSANVSIIQIHLVNGVTGIGYNCTNGELEVGPHNKKSVAVTVGLAGTEKPIIRFWYRYNRKIYSVEATMPE